MSQSSVIRPNTATKYRPLHLVAQAMPRQRPASSRQGRQPSHGPNRAPRGAVEPGRQPAPAPSRGRPRSAPNAASAQNISSGSSSAVRLCTNASPSTASSSPATQPSSVERNSRRPIRAIISTDRVPVSGDHEPPAERREPEQLLADRDHPLAARRVHDVGRVAGPEPLQVAREDLDVRRVGVALLGSLDVVLLDAEVQQRPGVLRVVGLVEDERLRPRQVPEPQHARRPRSPAAGRASPTAGLPGIGGTSRSAHAGRGRRSAAAPGQPTGRAPRRS